MSEQYSPQEAASWQAPITGQNEPEPQPEPEISSVLDMTVVKRAYDKCMATYDDKYRNGLFGINVLLEPDELQQIDLLIQSVREKVDMFIAQTPNYDVFQDYLAQRRQKLGGFDEARYITVKDGIDRPTKYLVDGNIPALYVSQAIRNLYDWESILHDTSEDVRLYQVGASGGQMTKYLGNRLRQLNSFVKQV